ncbi:hypothetical protein [Vibrio aerogenes]|uniref:hypothetical protein n=1 Tax=Vibrio aerogenes TaxID=92172 RepID=UPI0009374314|nr:hypothetical protein [Vibrio aerogenes]
MKDWAQGCASNPAPASDHQKAFSPLFRPEKGLGRVHYAPLGSTKLISAPNLPLKPESSEMNTRIKASVPISQYIHTVFFKILSIFYRVMIGWL